MAEMSLRDQIRAMEGMEQDLKECVNLMDDMVNEMSDKINYLRGEGFTSEKEEEYRSLFFNPAKSAVDDVINNINRYHIKYLDETIEDMRGI